MPSGMKWHQSFGKQTRTIANTNKTKTPPPHKSKFAFRQLIANPDSNEEQTTYFDSIRKS